MSRESDVGSLYSTLTSIEQIQGLINDETRESVAIEYKRAETKFSDKAKREVPKDVSAFANSSGGVLIYGVATARDDKTRPTEILGIAPENIETFDRVLNSGVRPEIPNIQKRVIRGDDTTIMVVHVPQSLEAPHQSLEDFRYYRRSGAESLPMEHDLVSLYFGRRRAPVIKVRTADVVVEDAPGGDGMTHNVEMKLQLHNAGRRVARDLLTLFQMVIDPADCIIETAPGRDLSHLSPGQRRYQIMGRPELLHPGTAEVVASFKARIRRGSDEATPLFAWTTLADDMEPQNGVIVV